MTRTNYEVSLTVHFLDKQQNKRSLTERDVYPCENMIEAQWRLAYAAILILQDERFESYEITMISGSVRPIE